MKIHFLAIGFTPGVFKPIASIGADKIIGFHIGPEDKKNKEVINFLEKNLGIKVVKKRLEPQELEKLAKEVKKIVEKETNPGDEVYFHIGGGQRELGLALTLVSLALDYPVNLVLSRPGVKPVITKSVPVRTLLTEKQIKALKEINKTITLTELAEKLKIAKPGVHRMLSTLARYGLVEKVEGGWKRSLVGELICGS